PAAPQNSKCCRIVVAKHRPIVVVTCDAQGRLTDALHGCPGFSNAGQNRPEDSFAKDDQGCYGADTGGGNAVSTGVENFTDQFFATELFEIVSRPASVIVGIKDGRSNVVCQLSRGEPLRRTGQG